MAEYSEIEKIISEMKRSAADAYMGEQGWFPDVKFQDRYSLWGFIPSYFGRPDEDGEGGGERIGISGRDTGDMVSSFEGIREAIDRATKRWVNLPSGAGAASPRSQTNSVAAQFGAAASGGTVIVDGEVAKSIGTINNMVISNMRGSFQAPFLDKYDAQFAKIIGGLSAATAILETAYGAEEVMWKAARQDAVEICSDARNAFRMKAGQGASQVSKTVLTVVGLVAGVVTTIASAGTAAPIVTILGLASTAAGAVKELNSDVAISTDSFQSILDSLQTSSVALDTAITAQEQSLKVMLADTNELIESEAGNFNLDSYRLSVSEKDGTLALEQTGADTVLNNMQRLIDALGSATTKVSEVPGDDFLRRNEKVGIGATGPYEQLSELHENVYQCLKQTHNEYVRGRDLFSAVVDEYNSVEERAEAISNALLLELESERVSS